MPFSVMEVMSMAAIAFTWCYSSVTYFGSHGGADPTAIQTVQTGVRDPNYLDFTSPYNQIIHNSSGYFVVRKSDLATAADTIIIPTSDETIPLVKDLPENAQELYSPSPPPRGFWTVLSLAFLTITGWLIAFASVVVCNIFPVVQWLLHFFPMHYVPFVLQHEVEAYDNLIGIFFSRILALLLFSFSWPFNHVMSSSRALIARRHDRLTNTIQRKDQHIAILATELQTCMVQIRKGKLDLASQNLRLEEAANNVTRTAKVNDDLRRENRELGDLQRRLTDAEAKVHEQAAEDVPKLKADLAAEKSRKERCETDLRKTNSKFLDAIQNGLLPSHTVLSRYKRQAEDAKDGEKLAREGEERLKKQLETKQLEAREKIRQLRSNLQAEKTTQAESSRQHQKEIRQKEQQNSKLQQTITEHSQALANRDEELEAVKASNSELQQVKLDLTRDRGQAQTATRAAEALASQLSDDKGKLSSDVQNLQTEVSRLQRQHDEEVDKQTKLKADFEESQAAVSAVNAELRERLAQKIANRKPSSVKKEQQTLPARRRHNVMKVTRACRALNKRNVNVARALERSAVEAEYNLRIDRQIDEARIAERKTVSEQYDARVEKMNKQLSEVPGRILRACEQVKTQVEDTYTRELAALRHQKAAMEIQAQRAIEAAVTQARSDEQTKAQNQLEQMLAAARNELDQQRAADRAALNEELNRAQAVNDALQEELKEQQRKHAIKESQSEAVKKELRDAAQIASAKASEANVKLAEAQEALEQDNQIKDLEARVRSFDAESVRLSSRPIRQPRAPRRPNAPATTPSRQPEVPMPIPAPLPQEQPMGSSGNEGSSNPAPPASKQDKGKGKATEADEATPAVNFDSPTADLTFGPEWTDMTPEQQEEFVAAVQQEEFEAAVAAFQLTDFDDDNGTEEQPASDTTLSDPQVRALQEELDRLEAEPQGPPHRQTPAQDAMVDDEVEDNFHIDLE